MRTERINSNPEKTNFVKRIERIKRVTAVRKNDSNYEEILEEKRKQQENLQENSNKENSKERTNVTTPQQAYEMQKSDLKAERITKTEKEKVKEFKEGYSRYEQHLEEVANMQEREYQRQHSKEQDDEREEEK